MIEKKQESKNPFQQLVRGRRSIRRYLEKPVEREKILNCIEAARLAPSADNVQFTPSEESPYLYKTMSIIHIFYIFYSPHGKKW